MGGSKAKNRIDAYDIAKGIGILIVLIGHSLPEGSVGRIFIYSFHMPLFFILSGLVMKGNGSFSLKSCIRQDRKLVLNYAFFSVVYLVFDVIVRYFILHSVGAKSFILECWQTVILFGINVLWFLSTLFIGKIIVRAVCAKVRRPLIQVIMAVAIFAVTCLAAIFIPDSASGLGFVLAAVYYLVVSVVRAIMMSSFILVGFAVREYVRRFVTGASPIIGGGVGAIAICLTALLSRYVGVIDYHYAVSGFSPLAFVTALLGTGGIIGISMAVERVKRLKSIFMMWGKNSLFVMATHEYLMLKTLIMTVALFLVPGMADNVQIVIEIIGIIVVEWILCIVLAPVVNGLVNRAASIIDNEIAGRK